MIKKYNSWSEINSRLCLIEEGYHILMQALMERYAAIYRYSNIDYYTHKPLTKKHNNRGYEIKQILLNINTTINGLIPKFVNHLKCDENTLHFDDWEMWSKESIYTEIGEEPIELYSDGYSHPLDSCGFPVKFFEQKKKILNLLLWQKTKLVEPYDYRSSYYAGSSNAPGSDFTDPASAYAAALNNIIDNPPNSNYSRHPTIFQYALIYIQWRLDSISHYQSQISGINSGDLLRHGGIPTINSEARKIKYSCKIYYKFEAPVFTGYTGVFDGSSRGFINGWNLMADIPATACFDESLYRWGFNTKDLTLNCPPTPTLEFNGAVTQYCSGYQSYTSGYLKKFDVDGGFKFLAGS